MIVLGGGLSNIRSSTSAFQILLEFTLSPMASIRHRARRAW